MKNIAPMCFASLILFSGACHSQANQTGDTQDTEAIAQRYVESFKKSGVPTADAVNAAVRRARETGTIPNWEIAARLANSYANVLGAMKEHYSYLFRSSRIQTYIEKAAEYETQQNEYLNIRNDAYLSQAELQLKTGNKSSALSLAMTSMRLSGITPNFKAESPRVSWRPVGLS